MPNRATRRNGAASEVDAKLSITCGGHKYEMQFGDFSALDEFDYYQETGQTITAVFSGNEITTFAIAGLLWLYRRRYEKTLTFREVAAELKFSDLSSVEIDDGTEDEDDDEVSEVVGSDPEA